MGVYVGPNLDENNVIFYFDGRNSKSFSSNKLLTSLITGESKNTTFASQNGYIYSNYGDVNKFTNFSISNLSAITLNFSLDDITTKQGFAFSICDNLNSFHSGISSNTSYSVGIASLVGVSSISSSYSIGVSSNTSISGILTTSSETVVSSLYNVGVSSNTSYSVGIASLVGVSSISSSYSIGVSSNTTYSHTTLNLSCQNIASHSFYPQFELSVNVDYGTIQIINNNSSSKTTLNYKNTNQTNNIFSVVFRTLGSNIKPISLYQNGSLISESDQKSGSSQFSDVGISLFSFNRSSYSTYGTRFLSIHNKGLSANEISSVYINLK